jgi:hypothetical protein
MLMKPSAKVNQIPTSIISRWPIHLHSDFQDFENVSFRNRAKVFGVQYIILQYL